MNPPAARPTAPHAIFAVLRSARTPSAEGGSFAEPPPQVVQRYEMLTGSSEISPQRPAASPATSRPKSARGKSRGPSSARKGGKKSRRSPPTKKGNKATAAGVQRSAAPQDRYPDLSGSPPGAFRGVAEPRTVPSPPEGHLDGRRHEGQATSGEGLGPNGRPGTAVGGARARLRHFAPQPVAEQVGRSHIAPSPIVDIWADAGARSAIPQDPPQPVTSSPQARGSAAPVPPPAVPRSRRAAAASGLAKKRTSGSAAGAVKVKGALTAHSKGVNMMSTRRAASASSKSRGAKAVRGKGANGGSKRASTASSAKRPSRKVENPTGAATLAGQRAAALKRSARAAHAAKQREENELAALKQRLAAAHSAAIKDRVANWRVQESRFLKRAAKRAAAADHTQRVMTIRTTRVLEDAQRATLALRLRRASEQARITAEYTKAIAAQEREAALEAAKAAAADSQAAEAALRAKQEAALHQLGITQALMKEAAAVQAADLRMAAQGQAQALRDSTRDILASGRAVELAAAQARESRDAQWTVQQFGDISAAEVRPLGSKPAAVVQAQDRWRAQGGDAQVRLLGDDELLQHSMSSAPGSAQEDSFLAHVGKQLDGHAADTQSAGFDFDEDWVVQSKRAPASGGVSAESSGYLGYPAYKAREVPATTTSRHGMVITRANAGLTPGDEPRLLNVRGSTFGRTSAGGGGGGYNTTRTEWA